MSKHIQGPLQVGYEFDETGYPLFIVAGLSGDQKRDRESLDATAKVFAAAPELLEALKRLLGSTGSGNASLHEEGCRCVIHEARAAIAKATT
jgi:hypothetical protein